MIATQCSTFVDDTILNDLRINEINSVKRCLMVNVWHTRIKYVKLMDFCRAYIRHVFGGLKKLYIVIKFKFNIIKYNML